MELLTLATDALTLALPFLTKSGEKIAENIGQEIWDLIKRPFTASNDDILNSDLTVKENQEKFKEQLTFKLSQDPSFENELKALIENKQQQLIANAQQNVNNHGDVVKQINIQTNTGGIQM